MPDQKIVRVKDLQGALLDVEYRIEYLRDALLRANQDAILRTLVPGDVIKISPPTLSDRNPIPDKNGPIGQIPACTIAVPSGCLRGREALADPVNSVDLQDALAAIETIVGTCRELVKGLNTSLPLTLWP